MGTSPNPAPDDVFTSWKQIAAYLGKGVRTVQRWEAQFGLPVLRPIQDQNGRSKGSVRVSRAELDAWLARSWSRRAAKMVKQLNLLDPEASHELRKEHHELVAQFCRRMNELTERCRRLVDLVETGRQKRQER